MRRVFLSSSSFLLSFLTEARRQRCEGKSLPLDLDLTGRGGGGREEVNIHEEAPPPTQIGPPDLCSFSSHQGSLCVGSPYYTHREAYSHHAHQNATMPWWAWLVYFPGIGRCTAL